MPALIMIACPNAAPSPAPPAPSLVRTTPANQQPRMQTVSSFGKRPRFSVSRRTRLSQIKANVSVLKLF